MSQPFTLDGEPAWNFAATSVFAEMTVVREIQCVKISNDVPLSSATSVMFVPLSMAVMPEIIGSVEAFHAAASPAVTLATVPAVAA